MNARRGILLVLLLILADQLSKYWVENFLPLQQFVPVIPFLSLFRTYNTGIAFSMFASLNGWALSAITLVIIGFVIWLWSRTGRGRALSKIGFALVIGGALGNLIDRLWLGHVVDFILLHTDSWSFAVFNFADSFITIGAMAIIVDELLEARRASPSEADR